MTPEEACAIVDEWGDWIDPQRPFVEVARTLRQALAEAQAARGGVIEEFSRAKADWLIERNALRRKLDAARDALRPFADAAADLDDETHDRSEIWEMPCAMSITAGDLRVAAALVN